MDPGYNQFFPRSSGTVAPDYRLQQQYEQSMILPGRQLRYQDERNMRAPDPQIWQDHELTMGPYLHQQPQNYLHEANPYQQPRPSMSSSPVQQSFPTYPHGIAHVDAPQQPMTRYIRREPPVTQYPSVSQPMGPPPRPITRFREPSIAQSYSVIPSRQFQRTTGYPAPQHTPMSTEIEPASIPQTCINGPPSPQHLVPHLIQNHTAAQCHYYMHFRPYRRYLSYEQFERVRKWLLQTDSEGFGPMPDWPRNREVELREREWESRRLTRAQATQRTWAEVAAFE